MATRRLLEAFEFRSGPYAFATVEAREVDAGGADTGRMIRLYDSPSGGSQLPNPFTLDRYGRVQQPTYFEQRHRLVGVSKALPGGFTTGVFETFPTPDDAGTTTPFLESADIGIKGDGLSSDVQAINRAATLWSAKGGATFWLTAAPGKSIFLDGSVLVPSGISLIFGSPVSYGTYGAIRVAGGRTVALAANLVVDVATLPTSVISVDTTSLGGQALSSYFAVGDYVDVVGQKDSGGWPIQSDEDVRVTAVNDGTSELTLARALTTAYARSNAGSDYTTATGLPDLTEVRKLVRALASADVAAGSRSGAFTTGLGGLAKGDHAILEDDKTCADAVAGSTSALIHREIVRVEDISGSTVTFDRKVRHAFEAAFHARLTRIDPAVDGHVSGAVPAFAAPAASNPVHSFELYCAVDSSIEDCRIENADLYGSRGTGYRTTLSYRSGYRRTFIRDPKFTAAGEGYGAAAFYATECFNDDHEAISCRHALLYLGDTGSTFERLKAKNSLFGHVDFHGCEERATAGAHVRTEGGSCLVSFGHDQSWSGTFDCYLEDVVSRDTTGAHVEFTCPASRCGVRDFRFVGGLQAWHGVDCPATGTAGDSVFGDDNYLEHGRVVGTTADWGVNLDGAQFDADHTRNAIRRPRLTDVTLEACPSTSFYLHRLADPRLEGVRVVRPVAAADPYTLDGSAISGRLVVEGGCWDGVQNGFRLANVAGGRVVNLVELDWTGGSEYNNNGGNSNIHAAVNTALGFSKTNALPA